jgi:predicted outer membrane protein
MFFFKRSPVLLLASACILASAAVPAGQDYGPKVEPSAMGSEYQPLLWKGSDAAFVLDTVGFGTCQVKVSGEAASRSSNPDVQHVAAESMELESRDVKKLRSMAKTIEFRFPKAPPPCAEAGELAQQSGEKFEKAYLDYLSKNNADALARFQVEANAPANSANFNLRKFAAANVSALSHQQSSIDTLRGKLSSGTK